MPAGNQLYYGDNLDVIRRSIPDESVDLIYLDPPFNSDATYNVLFKSHAGDDARAQIEAFDDTWHWSPQAEDEYVELTKGRTPIDVAKFIEAMRSVLGASDMLAYLVMMAPRLVEMRRVMKSSANIFLHCDPTASHYLKLLMDAVFEPRHFLNEIAWCYETGGRARASFPRKHDIILRYARSEKPAFFPANIALPRDFSTMHETVRTDTDGRRYQANVKAGKEYRYYEDEGVLPNDWWTDIQALNPAAKERLGYPTQKPRALLERIIGASTNPGDLVLDPFCGCGTAVDAAQQLERRWIGIDITYIAVDLIIKRLQHRYGDEIFSDFSTDGIPKDRESADALFARNPFDFERWAVSFVNGQPNEKQVGDKGIDGRIRFDNGKEKTGTVAVSVKGGRNVNPSMVQALVGATHQEGADMGLFISMERPSKMMNAAANAGGMYEHQLTGNRYPKFQIITIAELFDGKRPNMPTAILPYFKAQRVAVQNTSLFDQPTVSDEN